jgi:type IV secretion system protein VirB9
MRYLLPATVSVLALLTAIATPTGPSLAYTEPAAGKLDDRVRFVDFAPYQVTRIISTLRASVQVEFATDEDIIHVALGNAIAWEVAVKGNLLFLKPRELQPSTNMHVVTQKADKSQRTYQLEITAVRPELTDKLKPFFLVKFRYPADDETRAKVERQAKADAAKSGEAERILTTQELSGPKNYAYTAQGEAYFEPSAVSDNGKVTTFEFPDNTEIPAIFLAKDDGSETLVAKSVKGHTVIVHATSAKFVLRRGFEAICIFNEAYTPDGFDPGTNTVSSSVTRVVKSPITVKKAGPSVAGVVTPPVPLTAIAPVPPAPVSPLFAPGGALSGLNPKTGEPK